MVFVLIVELEAWIFFCKFTTSYIMRFSKKNFDRRRPAAVPPTQSWKTAFFRLFINILKYFRWKIVFKIVRDEFRNIQDQKLPAAVRHHRRRPPSHQNLNEMSGISIWVSILGFIGPLIPIMPLDFRSAAPPAVQGSPAARRHTTIQRRWQIYGYGCRFWDYLGR